MQMYFIGRDKRRKKNEKGNLERFLLKLLESHLTSTLI